MPPTVKFTPTGSHAEVPPTDRVRMRQVLRCLELLADRVPSNPDFKEAAASLRKSLEYFGEVDEKAAVNKDDLVRMRKVLSHLDFLASKLPLVTDFHSAAGSLRKALDYFGAVDEQEPPDSRTGEGFPDSSDAGVDGQSEGAPFDDDGVGGADESPVPGDEVPGGVG